MGRDLRGRLQPWFHGIISREETEQLMAGQPQGAYLVRVSARIWGYTISFMEGGKVKHFLVDVVDGQYTVFSASSRAHADLNTLIAFHSTLGAGVRTLSTLELFESNTFMFHSFFLLLVRFPISKAGTMLTKPVGDPNGNRSLGPLMS